MTESKNQPCVCPGRTICLFTPTPEGIPLNKRNFLSLAACLALCLPMMAQAQAQDIPKKSLTVVVGFAAGGAANAAAQVITFLSEKQ